MRTARICILSAVMLCGPAIRSGAETQWVIDALPGAFLASYNADAFSAESSAGKETMSLVSSMPSVSAGIAIMQPEGYFELRLNGGLLLNSRLRGYQFGGTIGLSLEAKPGVIFGPHAGISYYPEPDWWGDGDIVLSSSTGFNGGLHLAMGDKVSYLVSVDYYSVDFDATAGTAGWTPSQDSLDMSGFAVQFGIRALF